MNFCILFGGNSYEHEISIVSAISLKKLLPNLEHFIFLDGQGDFYLIPKDKMQSTFFSQKNYLKCTKLYLQSGGFYQKSFLGFKPLLLPTILCLVHGGDGEDGKIASLLDFFKIPFIGPRNSACVLSFDKELTKLLCYNRDVKSLPFTILYKHEEIPSNLTFPLIIKPARLGSSIGISLAKNQEELEYALEVAFEFDEKVLIEPFINGIKEYNLAGFKGKDGLVFSIIEEPQKKEFLDFDKKYLDFSRTKEIQKANLTPQLEEKLKDNFAKIYNHLFEGALIRCDFFIKDEECYLNEINPIPGSLANYLFSDFKTALEDLSKALPKPKDIRIAYEFLHKIQFAKGK
ncbi:D-alanine--D-alanine ligase A [Helicobacter valdiviensis]|uniref:D-alanine--D-alanine ligase n=1 Tax=Helicobacter valdiviensis TaxID=1458358 RepID=A0A2W6MXL8_9HELI|nr:D-alanine--D-alanine ligase [Helicobacter valdiviensis]PZT48681.1 D-alanine--D-alanine ligase A [Helicobacter valdiviensis]